MVHFILVLLHFHEQIFSYDGLEPHQLLHQHLMYTFMSSYRVGSLILEIEVRLCEHTYMLVFKQIRLYKQWRSIQTLNLYFPSTET